MLWIILQISRTFPQVYHHKLEHIGMLTPANIFGIFFNFCNNNSVPCGPKFWKHFTPTNKLSLSTRNAAFSIISSKKGEPFHTLTDLFRRYNERNLPKWLQATIFLGNYTDFSKFVFVVFSVLPWNIHSWSIFKYQGDTNRSRCLDVHKFLLTFSMK